jgi:hypothetical protein
MLCFIARNFGAKQQIPKLDCFLVLLGTQRAEVIMESKLPNDDNFMDSLEIPDDGLAYFDFDKLDPSNVYRNEEDKRYLELLSELQCEAIIAECLERLKNITEMKRTLSCLESQSSGGLSYVESGLYDGEGAYEKIYVPPFLRAPDHHLLPYFKNSPDQTHSELATDEAAEGEDDNCLKPGAKDVVETAADLVQDKVFKSVREHLPDLDTEQVDDNFLNPVDDKLSGLGNEAMDGDVLKQAAEQVARVSHEALQEKVSNTHSKGDDSVKEIELCNPTVYWHSSP